MSRPCGCELGCKPDGGSSLLHPGIVWADVVREIQADERVRALRELGDLGGRRRTEES